MTFPTTPKNVTCVAPSQPRRQFAKSARPNILLIVMDATRAQNLSVYGYPRRTTPFLEMFAESCMVYENAIATSCWSLPCHASLFTGLYPSVHGADDQHQFLDAEHPIIGEFLNVNHGYRTLAFCTKRDISPVTGMHRGFQEFNPEKRSLPFHGTLRKLDNGVAKMMGTRDGGMRRTNQQLATLLPKLQANGEPFFIFLSTVESHIPYRPPKKYTHFLPKGVSSNQVAGVNMDRWKYMVGETEMGEQDFEILRALYDGGITYTDARLAELFAGLQRLNLLDDMLIIITGDHGENLGEHGLMAHGYCLYDTVVHVPLIIHYPQSLGLTGRVSRQVQSVDVLPTILNLLGDESATRHRSLQGHSLLSTERHEFTVAEQANPDMTIFKTRFPNKDVSRYDRYLRMIRTEAHKFIWASDGQHELYDLQADPHETRNLIQREPPLALRLAQELKDWQLAHTAIRRDSAFAESRSVAVQQGAAV
ncbi:MAG TPA: sulfatase [Anaerolineae bacterium]|nr:sulfatase [Anaerolineae bacterium]